MVPPARVVGAALKVRVNGGPPLRLLLDSGAQDLVLDRRAAARSGLSGDAPFLLVGPGGEPSQALRSEVEILEAGTWSARHVSVVIAPRTVIAGLDGVAPLTLFNSYLIRLDLGSRMMELYPPPGLTAQRDPGDLEIRHRELLLVGATIESEWTYFLLDTGACQNAISSRLARKLGWRHPIASKVPMRSGIASVDATPVPAVIRLRIGEIDLRVDPAVAVDLSAASQYNEIEIGGLIGFPTLRDRILTVDYQRSLVHLERR